MTLLFYVFFIVDTMECIVCIISSLYFHFVACFALIQKLLEVESLSHAPPPNLDSFLFVWLFVPCILLPDETCFVINERRLFNNLSLILCAFILLLMFAISIIKKL